MLVHLSVLRATPLTMSKRVKHSQRLSPWDRSISVQMFTVEPWDPIHFFKRHTVLDHPPGSLQPRSSLQLSSTMQMSCHLRTTPPTPRRKTRAAVCGGSSCGYPVIVRRKQQRTREPEPISLHTRQTQIFKVALSPKIILLVPKKNGQNPLQEHRPQAQKHCDPRDISECFTSKKGARVVLFCSSLPPKALASCLLGSSPKLSRSRINKVRFTSDNCLS